MSLSRCPVCNATNATPLRDDVEDFEYFVQPEYKFTVARCRTCDSEFLDPRPTEESIATFYPDSYHAYHADHSALASALVALRARGRARYYDRLVGSGSRRVFDVGVGDCRHFDALARRGAFEFSGVDIKKEMVDLARRKGYDVVHGTLESMDISGHAGRYDIVSMNHVIEHVIDPRQMAQRAFELLKPGGVAVGQLPTNSCWESRLFGRYWAGYHFPRHLQAFSRRGLTRLLTEAGFGRVRVISVPHVQSAISIQNWLIGHGWRPRMKFGKTSIYSLLLLLVMPFELAAFLFRRGGIVNFEAWRPR